MKQDPTIECVVAAAQAADSKKATDISVLEVGPVLAITDYFVIVSANNRTLVKTVVEEVERKVKQLFDRAPRSVEGLEDASWVLIDYGDFVVHVFLNETRDYYDLDRLWTDVGQLEWTATAATA